MRSLVSTLSMTLLLALPLVAMAAGGGRFTVTSVDFTNGGTIPMAQVFNSFGCSGGNQSPALHWSGVPAGTKSFAVTIYDPNAPTGSGWWHWIIYDIPANVTALPRNAGDPRRRLAPRGSVQTRSDFGTPGYGGPCPPKGDDEHRYMFKVYALDVAKLPVKPDSMAIPLHLHFHSLAQAILTGTYARAGGSYVP